MNTFKRFITLTTAAAIFFSAFAAPSFVYADETDASFEVRMNELMPRDKNYMFSPYSLKLALAMTANGAEGKTREELLDVLDIDDLDKFNADTKALITCYTDADEDIYQAPTFNIANSIWLNTDPDSNPVDARFSPEFAAKVGEYYFAEADTVTSGTALEKINGWCNEKTNGKIPTILNDPHFLACLVNAVYFKAKWEDRFIKEKTYEETFTDRNGGVATVDFMHQTNIYPYYEDENMQIAALPYLNSSIAMYLILSDDKRVDISDILANKFDKNNKCKVILSVPKFKIEYEEETSGFFKTLGAETPFTVTRDLAPMFDKTFESYISAIYHKTYIDVDEEGTEAAAVTAVTVEASTGGGGPVLPTKVFRADKPFTFVIADQYTHDIYFMGEYAFPDKGSYKPVILPSKGYKTGDADNDNKLTAADAAFTLQKALISTFETPVEKVDTENLEVVDGNVTYKRSAVMDMNKNGAIDADDAAQILQNVLTSKRG